MRFDSIEINNFRGIKHLVIDDLKQINLFAGCNNSGKTSILESIFLLVGMSNPQLSNTINVFRDFLIGNTDEFKLFFYDLNSKEIILTGTDSSLKYSRELRITNIIDNKIVNNITNQENSISTSTDTLITNKSKGLNLDFTVKEFQKPAIKGNSKIFIEKGELKLIEDKNYTEKIIAIFQSPRFSNETVMSRLDKIINDKQESEIIKILQKIEPRIERIMLGKNSMINVDIGLNSLVPINIMGDGIRKLLSIVTSMYNMSNSILLVDEIDNGLHHSAMKTMWRAIIYSAKKFNIQIFVTTHNFDTLKALKELIEEEMPDFSNEIRHYSIQKRNLETKAFKYDFEKFEFAIEQGIEIRN